MNSPIGIFDSGLGGLSVLNEVRKTIPNESIIYFGDSAWCPYGVRKADEIQQRVFQVTDFLIEQGCKLIIVACNSATIAAVEALRATYPLPFIGMEPGVKPAAKLTKSGIVGILATEASLAGEKFHRLVDTHAGDIKVITRPCPSFVELVEAGEISGDHARKIIEGEILPLLDTGADVLVLGCTHYPFLRPLIKDISGPGVAIVDTSNAVAIQAKNILQNKCAPATPSFQIYTSGSLEHLERILPMLCPTLSASLYHRDLR